MLIIRQTECNEKYERDQAFLERRDRNWNSETEGQLLRMYFRQCTGNSHSVYACSK